MPITSFILAALQAFGLGRFNQLQQHYWLYSDSQTSTDSCLSVIVEASIGEHTIGKRRNSVNAKKLEVKIRGQNCVGICM